MPYVTSKLVIDDVQVFLNGIGSTSTRPQRSLSGCRVLTQVVVTAFTALYLIRNIGQLGRCLSYGDNVVAFVHLRNRALLRHRRRRHRRRRRRHRRRRRRRRLMIRPFFRKNV